MRRPFPLAHAAPAPVVGEQAPAALELVPPRLNEKTPAAVENLLQALALDARQPFSLEVTGAPGRVRFLARAATAEMHAHLAGQFRLAYPEAELRPVSPQDDPARAATKFMTAACELRLRGANHLPLKDYRDRDWQDGGADPILALLAALGDACTDTGGLALCQFVLRPAPPDWSRGLERLALENPVQVEQRLEAERLRPRTHTGGGPGAAFVLVAMGSLAGWLQVQTWLQQGDLRPVFLSAGALALAVPLALVLLHTLNRPRSVHDPKLVAQKIGRVGYYAQIRLVAAASTRADAERWLRRLQATYAQYSLATGNSLVPSPWAGDPADLEDPTTRRGFFRRALPLLTAREIATLWHLPQGADQVAYLDRTASRCLPPTPAALAVGDGCPIGASRHQGRTVDVTLPGTALARNMLLVAKTGKGKSTLMQRLAVWLAGRGEACVVVFDPHGDLARAVLGALPVSMDRDRIASVDFADTERPIGLNLLDAYTGRDRDKTVANIIDVFSRVWSQFWGPRMEDALRYSLLALYEVNAQLPPDRQYGALHVKRLLLDEPFRRALLPLVRDYEVKEWWRRDYALMPRNFAHEVVKPVITKLNRFAGTEAARNIVSQPRTTLDVRQVVRDRGVLLVNTAASVLGPGTSGLLGATLLDLLGLAIMEQGTLAPEQRVPVWVAVDEFQTLPAVDWAELLGQLRKFGGRFTLATQALARLDATDPALRGTVFGNIDTLGVFQTSAEDARYLKHELDGAVDEVDLANLPDHQLYLKTSGASGRLPTCLVQTHPPVTSDPLRAATLARESARRLGRLTREVEELRKVVGRQHHAWARETTNQPADDAPERDTRSAGAEPLGTGPSDDRELHQIQAELDL